MIVAALMSFFEGKGGRTDILMHKAFIFRKVVFTIPQSELAKAA